MKKPRQQESLWVIVKGDKNSTYPVILCTRYHTMRWESERTKEGHTVMLLHDPEYQHSSWILKRYKGYEIDDLHESSPQTLFDGKSSEEVVEDLKSQIQNAVWWSYDKMPEWVVKVGIKCPEDESSRRAIKQDSGTCLTMSPSKEYAYKLKREEYLLPWE